MAIKTKVMVATVIGPGKEYCVSFLHQVLVSLEAASSFLVGLDGVELSVPKTLGKSEVLCDRLPEWEGAVDERYARFAWMREWCRDAFLASDCTHLYFHDCDMVPPSDIIPRLLAHEAHIVTGIYACRGVTLPILPIMAGWEGRCTGALATQTGVLSTENDVIPVEGFGQGCMLLSRHVLESVAYRDRAYFQAEPMGEDYRFCLDAAEIVGAVTLLDVTLGCWHVDDAGFSNRPIVGGLRNCAVWQDAPWQVRNQFGLWQKDIPHYNITEEQGAMLGPGFHFSRSRDVTLETAQVEAITCSMP